MHENVCLYKPAKSIFSMRRNIHKGSFGKLFSNYLRAWIAKLLMVTENVNKHMVISFIKIIHF